MMDPRYRDVKKADIPEVALPGGVTARVICGTVGEGARPGPGHRHRPGVPRRHHAAADRVRPPDQARPHGLRLRLRGRGLLLGRSRACRPTTSSRPAISTSSGSRSRATTPSSSSATASRVQVTTTGLARPFPAHLGPAPRRARGLAGAHRHEHPGGAPDGLPRVPGRDVHQDRIKRLERPEDAEAPVSPLPFNN